VIRRSFRIGLWLGLLIGIGFAVAKIFRPKPEQSFAPTAREWPPLEPSIPKPAAAPAPVVSPPAPTPVVQEPAPAPVEKAPVAKKAAAPAKKAPVAKKAASPAPAKKVLAAWVDPEGNICPQTHPVKAKLSSKIFQVPGNFAYDRTKPDRCYESPEAATKDGMRAAKR